MYWVSIITCSCIVAGLSVSNPVPEGSSRSEDVYNVKTLKKADLFKEIQDRRSSLSLPGLNKDLSSKPHLVQKLIEDFDYLKEDEAEIIKLKNNKKTKSTENESYNSYFTDSHGRSESTEEIHGIVDNTNHKRVIPMVKDSYTVIKAEDPQVTTVKLKEVQRTKQTGSGLRKFDILAGNKSNSNASANPEYYELDNRSNDFPGKIIPHKNDDHTTERIMTEENNIQKFYNISTQHHDKNNKMFEIFNKFISEFHKPNNSHGIRKNNNSGTKTEFQDSLFRTRPRFSIDTRNKLKINRAKGEEKKKIDEGMTVENYDLGTLLNIYERKMARNVHSDKNKLNTSEPKSRQMKESSDLLSNISDMTGIYKISQIVQEGLDKESEKTMIEQQKESVQGTVLEDLSKESNVSRQVIGEALSEPISEKEDNVKSISNGEVPHSEENTKNQNTFVFQDEVQEIENTKIQDGEKPISEGKEIESTDKYLNEMLEIKESKGNIEYEKTAGNESEESLKTGIYTGEPDSVTEERKNTELYKEASESITEVNKSTKFNVEEIETETENSKKTEQNSNKEKYEDNEKKYFEKSETEKMSEIEFEKSKNTTEQVEKISETNHVEGKEEVFEIESEEKKTEQHEHTSENRTGAKIKVEPLIYITTETERKQNESQKDVDDTNQKEKNDQDENKEIWTDGLQRKELEIEEIQNSGFHNISDTDDKMIQPNRLGDKEKSDIEHIFLKTVISKEGTETSSLEIQKSEDTLAGENFNNSNDTNIESQKVIQETNEILLNKTVTENMPSGKLNIEKSQKTDINESVISTSTELYHKSLNKSADERDPVEITHKSNNASKTENEKSPNVEDFKESFNNTGKSKNSNELYVLRKENEYNILKSPSEKYPVTEDNLFDISDTYYKTGYQKFKAQKEKKEEGKNHNSFYKVSENENLQGNLELVNQTESKSSNIKLDDDKTKSDINNTNLVYFEEKIQNITENEENSQLIDKKNISNDFEKISPNVEVVQLESFSEGNLKTDFNDKDSNIPKTRIITKFQGFNLNDTKGGPLTGENTEIGEPEMVKIKTISKEDYLRNQSKTEDRYNEPVSTLIHQHLIEKDTDQNNLKTKNTQNEYKVDDVKTTTVSPLSMFKMDLSNKNQIELVQEIKSKIEFHNINNENSQDKEKGESLNNDDGSTKTDETSKENLAIQSSHIDNINKKINEQDKKNVDYTNPINNLSDRNITENLNGKEKNIDNTKTDETTKENLAIQSSHTDNINTKINEQDEKNGDYTNPINNFSDRNITENLNGYEKNIGNATNSNLNLNLNKENEQIFVNKQDQTVIKDVHETLVKENGNVQNPVEIIKADSTVNEENKDIQKVEYSNTNKLPAAIENSDAENKPNVDYKVGVVQETPFDQGTFYEYSDIAPNYQDIISFPSKIEGLDKNLFESYHQPTNMFPYYPPIAMYPDIQNTHPVIGPVPNDYPKSNYYGSSLSNNGFLVLPPWFSSLSSHEARRGVDGESQKPELNSQPLFDNPSDYLRNNPYFLINTNQNGFALVPSLNSPGGEGVASLNPFPEPGSQSNVPSFDFLKSQSYDLNLNHRDLSFLPPLFSPLIDPASSGAIESQSPNNMEHNILSVKTSEEYLKSNNDHRSDLNQNDISTLSPSLNRPETRSGMESPQEILGQIMDRNPQPPYAASIEYLDDLKALPAGDASDGSVDHGTSQVGVETNVPKERQLNFLTYLGPTLGPIVSSYINPWVSFFVNRIQNGVYQTYTNGIQNDNELVNYAPVKKILEDASDVIETKTWDEQQVQGPYMVPQDSTGSTFYVPIPIVYHTR